MPYAAAQPRYGGAEDHPMPDDTGGNSIGAATGAATGVPSPTRKKPSLLIGDEKSLTLAFLHKPSRSNSGSGSREYQRLMEENTKRNKNSGIASEDVSSPAAASVISDTDEGSIQLSPSSVSIPLARKKSGEFVRSSLKNHSRSASLPSTPTYKQVHFGGDDPSADVKYFDERDTPRTISGNNSPTAWEHKSRDYFSLDADIDDLYSEYNESAIEDDSNASLPSSDSYTRKLMLNGEWRLTLSNFPELSYPVKFKDNSKVFLERIYINDDSDNLCGQVAVKNISFAKRVVVCYSADDWRSVTEIESHYVPTSTAKLRRNKYDRFEFELPLVTLFHNTESDVHHDHTDAHSKFSLCIKYQTGGQEFWDNNESNNFNVVLHKITQNSAIRSRGETEYPKGAKHSSKFLSKKRSETKLNKNAADEETDHHAKDGWNSQSLLDRYINATNQEAFSPASPDTPRMSNTPYSPIELNPRNKTGFELEPIDALDINHSSSVTPAGVPPDEALSPALESPRSGSPVSFPSVADRTNNNSLDYDMPRYTAHERPSISSAKYQELLDRYCFFGGDSSSASTATVSSVLGRGSANNTRNNNNLN